MLKQALEKLVTEIVVSLARELWEQLRDAPDAHEAEARVRGLMKQRGHEQVHNALVRATR